MKYYNYELYCSLLYMCSYIDLITDGACTQWQSYVFGIDSYLRITHCLLNECTKTSVCNNVKLYI